MSTHISWFNFQRSLNPFEPQQDSNQLPQKNNENSISYFGKYSSFPKQQQSKSLFNIQAILQNLVGKSEGLLNKEQVASLHILNGFNSAPNPSESQPEIESQIQQPSREMEELGSRKGLKNLAKLLIRTLKKKKFDSSKYLTEEIEEKLMKGKKLSKNEHLRESKNIRRRTYDALNVMIAANVLGPDLAFIRRVNSGSFTKKCALIIGQKNQFETKIINGAERITKKKQFLEQLQKKKQALEWWMEQKKLEEETNSTNQQPENNNSEQKQKYNKGRRKFKKISLPVVVISEKQPNLSRQIRISKEGVLKVNCSNTKIKVFSDIDCFKILKRESQMEEEVNDTFLDQENATKSADKKQIEEQKAPNNEDFFSSIHWNES